MTLQVFTGRLRALPESGRPTGMYKQIAEGPLDLGPEGFVEDQQADRRVHGGPEKALHLYPATHYARLATAFPEAAPLLQPGCLGENLSTAAFDETTVCVGDCFGLGDARLQVSQPRSPCWKIDERCGVEGMAAFIADHGLTGWYFRVLTPARIAPNAALTLLERPNPDWPLARCLALGQALRPPLAEVDSLIAAQGMAPDWREKWVKRRAWLAANPGGPAPAPTRVHGKPDQAA